MPMTLWSDKPLKIPGLNFNVGDTVVWHKRLFSIVWRRIEHGIYPQYGIVQKGTSVPVYAVYGKDISNANDTLE